MEILLASVCGIILGLIAIYYYEIELARRGEIS